MVFKCVVHMHVVSFDASCHSFSKLVYDYALIHKYIHTYIHRAKPLIQRLRSFDYSTVTSSMLIKVAQLTKNLPEEISLDSERVSSKFNLN